MLLETLPTTGSLQWNLTPPVPAYPLLSLFSFLFSLKEQNSLDFHCFILAYMFS
jgi:hypothetical protein